MITHANLLCSLADIDRLFQHQPESVSVSWLPHFHDMGLVYGIAAPVYYGFECVLMSPVSFLQQPLRWLTALSAFAPPTAAGRTSPIDSVSAGSRLPTARRSICGTGAWRSTARSQNGTTPSRRSRARSSHAASIATRSVRRMVWRRRRSRSVRKHRDASLTTCRVVRSELERQRVRIATGDDSDARVVIGCGTPSPDVHVAIADPRARHSRRARFGRRGVGRPGPPWRPAIGGGPSRTRDTFGLRLADDPERRFLKTGDLGFLRGGELFIVGRSKDVIILAGQNHYPEDIEISVERAHAEVTPGACAAFGYERGGEERLAVVQELPRHAKNRFRDARQGDPARGSRRARPRHPRRDSRRARNTAENEQRQGAARAVPHALRAESARREFH